MLAWENKNVCMATVCVDMNISKESKDDKNADVHNMHSIIE